MKFKIASILELIIPLSVALLISAFLGCGGGAYGNGSNPFDGTWSLNLKGYAVPAPTPPAVTSVSCSERYTNIVITHGFGTVTEVIDCVDQTNTELANFPQGIDIGVTLTPASGIGGTAKAVTTGGSIDETGVCISRVACQTKNLLMIKCGEAASGC